MLLLVASAAFAQSPPAYPGTANVVVVSTGPQAWDYGVSDWIISGPASPTNASPGGWAVTVSGNSLTVTVPATAPLGEYTVDYGGKYLYTKGSAANGTDQQYYSVTSGAFRVVIPPPTKPAPGNPAFGWQGSVAGVNTGNGNKTTTLPIVGWTQRGGLPVSFALIHNSQGGLYGSYGYKWQASYFTYLSPNPDGSLTLHWDSGLIYTYTNSGSGTYTPPYGILDTLVKNGDGSYTLTTPSHVKYSFGFVPASAGGNAYLSAIADLDGNTLTINHNPNTSLSSVVDCAGRTVSLAYNANGQLATVTDPLGRQWTFSYTGAIDLQAVTNPSVGGQTYAVWFGYDGNHDIVSMQTPVGHANGYGSTFGYNGDSSLAWARDPLGSQTNFSYGPNSTTITDPNGHTLTHTYQVSRLASVTDALGKTETYAYDYNNILTSKTDKRGKTWNYSSHFSNNSPVSTSTDPLGNSSSTTTDANNKVLSSKDAIGNTTQNTYSTDGHDDLLSAKVTGTGTSPFQATSSVSGYASGLPTTFTDANSHPSSVAYDPYGWGYVTSATDANNITTRATYNALGWKLTSTDGQGRVTRYTYDPWGRVTVVTAPDGTQTGTVYDPNGNVLRVADADAYAATPLYAVHCSGNSIGHFSGDAYFSGGYGAWASPSPDASDVAGPVPAGLYTTQRLGAFTYTFPNLTPGKLYTLRLHFVESGHTAPGQRLFNLDINGGRALTNFDVFAAAGATNKAYIVEGSIAANGSGQIVVSFTPGAADVPVCSGLEVLPCVHTVSNNYDADDRLTSTFAATGNGNGDMVSYAYDGVDPANGNVTQKGLLSSKTDGNGHTTRYSYTARNEPAATYYPDGTGESVTYDANGNTLSRTKPDGKVIGYAYDADNRLTDITYPTLPAVHFDYDADSRRTHMHDGVGDTYWTYGDGLHLTHLNSNRGDVFYSYDAGSRRTSMTGAYVNPGSPYSAYVYNYDAGNRLTSLTNPFGETTSFLYNADGTVQKKTLANGAYTSYWYDGAGQTSDLQFVYPGWGGTYYHHYTYEPNGSLSSRSEDDGGVNSFGYDGMGQLVSEVRTGPVPFDHEYTYDHNGNRLTQMVNGQPYQSFTYDLHDKLTGGIGESESYDANGNLLTQTLSGQTTRLSWDDEDRLTSQTFPDGHTDSYTYTGLGMRLRKNDPTGNYWDLCDGVSPASPVLSDGYVSFTPGISEITGAGSRFYLPDAQGHSRGLLDGNQNGTDGYNWDGFGNLVSRVGSNPTGFAWNVSSGYQSDNDSGLVLMGHRYYDTRIGRFISQDPAGDGDNWYAYADNDPIDEVDPDGLFSQGMPSTDQTMSHDLMMGFMGGFEYGGSGFGGAGSVTVTKYTHTWFDVHPNGPGWVHEPGSDTYSQEDITFSMGGAMFAGPQNRGGGRLTPGEADEANRIASKMESLRRLAQKKTGQLYEDAKGLPGHAKDELKKPSVSRYGHRVRLQRDIKAPWGELRKQLIQILERAGLGAEAGIDDISMDFGLVYFDPHLADYYMRRRYPGGA